MTHANKRFSVYVIELHPNVLEHKRFMKKNPQHILGKPCIYVGMTGLSIEQRYANHERGHQSNIAPYVVRLIPELYQSLNPMAYEIACGIEVQLANKLRAEGYGVWQG